MQTDVGNPSSQNFLKMTIFLKYYLHEVNTVLNQFSLVLNLTVLNLTLYKSNFIDNTMSNSYIRKLYN